MSRDRALLEQHIAQEEARLSPSDLEHRRETIQSTHGRARELLRRYYFQVDRSRRPFQNINEFMNAREIIIGRPTGSFYVYTEQIGGEHVFAVVDGLGRVVRVSRSTTRLCGAHLRVLNRTLNLTKRFFGYETRHAMRKDQAETALRRITEARKQRQMTEQEILAEEAELLLAQATYDAEHSADGRNTERSTP